MRRMYLRLSRTASLAASAGLVLAGSLAVSGAAQPAGATTLGSNATAPGSIVYLKNGNVWIAHLNGSHARQFTKHKFDWSSPSEANNGMVVVAGGLPKNNPGGTDSDASSLIYKFSPNGNQIGKPIPTWGTFSSPSCDSFAPVSVQVSPDAKKIAYGIWQCSAPSYTALWTPSNSTTLNFPHQHVGQLDFYEPHWINNSTFLVSHVGPPVSDTQARWYTHGVNQADDTGFKGWTDSKVGDNDSQALISPDGDKLLIFEDDALSWTNGKPRLLRLWIWTGKNVPSNWTRRCEIKLNAAQTPVPLRMDPSVSSNSKELIWSDSRGVEEVSLATPANCASIKPHLLIRGGAEASFSAGSEKPGAAHPRQPGAARVG
jgi:hypothetical protein